MKKIRQSSALIFVSIALLLLLCPGALALSLSGKKLSPINYLPGETIINHYTISDTGKAVKVILEQGRFSNISVTEIVDNQFDLIINFPENEFIPTGSYNFALAVAEDSPDTDGGIGSQATVSKNFEVIVYSHEKDIQASLDMPSINLGKNATAKLLINSLGYPDINELFAILTLTSNTGEKSNPGQKLEKKVTEKKKMAGLESISFSVPFQTDTFPAGAYHLSAQIKFDEKEKKVNTSFLIGKIDVELVNATRDFSPGFNTFTAKIKSSWGNSLRNVYLKLFLNETELLQTPSIDLKPWEEAELKAILKVDLSPAEYQGKMRLFFESESKEIDFPFLVAAPPEPVQKLPEKKSFFTGKGDFFGMLPLAFVLLIALAVTVMIFLLRTKKNNEEF
ncbi:hypothetical protein HYX13_00175 [Candidatus Woesearchaeota archaeon]|nr:hypothetical protein [Candidatus Woesearchaeota archaeon]